VRSIPLRSSIVIFPRAYEINPCLDYHFDPQTNVIEVHISRLRSKIDKGHKQALLHTVRGEGYVLRDAADHQCESLRNVVKVDSEGIESDIRS